MAHNQNGGEKRPEVEVKGQGITGAILTGGREVVVKGAVMFILLYFLLASGDLFLRELVKLSPGLREKKQVVEISRTIEGSLSRYFFTVTLINFSEGFLLAVAMYLIGMPDPILMEVMATLIIYIPYIGPLIGIAIVAVVSFLTFSSTGHALLAPAIYAGLKIFQDYFMTPLILGVRFEINPAVSFMWLILWGWVWGIVGALLVFPTLTVFKILCDHIEGLAPIGEFLGR